MEPISVSIIVPVYNVEPYIKECFDSVASQTYCGPLECIFVDDCGTDDSMGVLDSCVESYKGNIDFRVVHHEKNRGISAARNTGIGEAKGGYVYFLDSDDAITPDCIQKLVEHVRKHPGVDMVCGGTLGKGRKWLQTKHKWWIPNYTCNSKWIKCMMLQRGWVPVTAYNKLVRKDLIIKNGIYFEEGLIHEDELWNFFMAKHVNSLAIERDATYLYRIVQGGIMSKSVSLMRYAPAVKVMLKNLSAPCLIEEVLCVLSYVESPDFEPLLKPLFDNYKLTRKVFEARLRTIFSSIYTVKGLFRQLAYRGWMLIFYLVNRNKEMSVASDSDKKRNSER